MDLKNIPNVAWVFLITGMFFVIAIIIMSSFQTTTGIAGDCSVVAKTDGGSDYFGVNTATNNVTFMNYDQYFTAYTAFTPRLNISVLVNESFTAGVKGELKTLKWFTPLNVSPTFKLYNGSTQINASNYTLYNSSANNWTINMTDSRFNGTTIYYTFNRTFIKNVEDLVTSPSSLYLNANISSFLITNTPTDYGVNKTFRLNPDDVGVFLNNTNWAVTWSYNNKSCISFGGNSAANVSIQNTITAMSEIPSNWLVIIAVVIAAGVVIAIALNMNNAQGRV